MIRSEVGVTGCATLAAVMASDREPLRVALTICFACLLADPDVFRLLVIACPFRTRRLNIASSYQAMASHPQFSTLMAARTRPITPISVDPSNFCWVGLKMNNSLK